MSALLLLASNKIRSCHKEGLNVCTCKSVSLFYKTFFFVISVTEDDVIVIPKTYFKDHGLKTELHAHFNHGFNEKL